jgi:hypothetical protein
MPKLKIVVYDGRIPKGEKLKRIVENLMAGGDSCDAVIALTDVYTGTADFADASDGKGKMSEWVGTNSRFYPHVALHDFEAWLLPFWSEIQRLAGHNRRAPAGPPERVNHWKPPAAHLKEIFRLGTCRDDYIKPRDALRILRGKDLSISAAVCPELKAFLNTILELCGGELIS